MKNAIQSLALAGYRLLHDSGVLRFSAVRRAFEISYDVYKSRIEATQIGALQRYVLPGTTVIDVGANIGFFTMRFAEWVSEPGKVVAIEPDHDNFQRLGLALRRRGRTAVVDLVQGAAADLDGPLHLVLNPHHPADHRLGPEGVPVPGYTLDRLMAERHWPPVSLIKIDVQGAEVRVLRGARDLLRRCCPVLFLEVDDGALARAGASAEILIGELAELGYEMYHVEASHEVPVDRAAAADKRGAAGYGDFLFKPSGTAFR